MKTIEEYRTQLERSKGQLESLQYQLKDNKTLILKAEKRQKAIEEAQALIQNTAKETQEQLRYHVEDLVQGAIDACFPDQYDFRMTFEMKRGRTEAEIYLEREGERIDPMDSSGGGVVDIIAFALRLSCWSLSRTDPVLIMDESFKFLSADKLPLACEVLKTLSKKLGLQIIQVTHKEEFIDISDKVFYVTLKNGKSKVIEKT